MVEKIESLHLAIRALCPSKSLTTIDNIIRPPLKTSTPKPPQVPLPPSRPMSVPTAAALKMGVGFPLTNLPGTNEDTNRILSTQCQNKSDILHECGICKHVNDQHLLAKCDTCHLHYHLGCLNPPLTRHPKKSKIYGWQCSECDEDNPDGVVQLTSGPRKSRTKYSKDGTIVPVDQSSRDVSLDGSADDERAVERKKRSEENSIGGSDCEQNSLMKVDDKNRIKTVQPVRSPTILKSAQKSPVSNKKSNHKCDKTEKNPIEGNKIEKSENDESILIKSPKPNGKPSPTPDSPLTNTNEIKSAHTPEADKTPTKRKVVKKSNLDKVIEAVSRGLSGLSNDEHDVEKKLNGTNETEVPVDTPSAPCETNGVAKSDDNPKSPIKQEQSPEPKAKTSKRPKKLKQKENGKEAASETEEQKNTSPVTISNVATSATIPTNDVPSIAKPIIESNKKEKKERQKKQKQKIKNEAEGKLVEPAQANVSKEKKQENIAVFVEPVESTAATEEVSPHENKKGPLSSPAVAMIDSKSSMDLILTNGVGTVQSLPTEGMDNGTGHKQSRKRRKEKHRSRHGSDGERSSSKEHKKKRKRKNHDVENPESFTLLDGVPKIKIKVTDRKTAPTI